MVIIRLATTALRLRHRLTQNVRRHGTRLCLLSLRYLVPMKIDFSTERLDNHPKGHPRANTLGRPSCQMFGVAK